MAERAHPLFYRAAAALAFVLLVAGCTKGGQFDPTEVFNSDVFDNKTKLKGERVPVFPDGVPGATTGVPADLVKGYQPPPDQPADADAAVPGPAPPPEAEPQKPKPKPKPKLAARKPAAAPASTPTRISVGSKSSTTQQQPAASQSVWPSPQANSGQPAAQPSQSVWPAPTQQAAQPSQSIWPNPQPPPTTSR
jgi:outer membrane biosynthesis protein TonB